MPVFFGEKSIRHLETSKMAVVRGWGAGDMRRCCSRGIKFQIRKKTSSQDLQHDTIPMINNTVLCTENFVKSVNVLGSEKK